jgi:two-component sensor histidine kinase
LVAWKNQLGGVFLLERKLQADVEAGRLAALRRYDILDTPPDGSFDRITALAADLFSVPIAIISLVDHDRIWFKSHHGLDVAQIDRAPGLCASAILQDGPWILTDARVDIRSLTNPLVAGEFGLRFYTGIPLQTQDGFNLGTLCVIDRIPRSVTDRQIDHLRHLASIVMDQMELRLSARRAISDLSQAVAEKEDALRRSSLMAKEADHRVKNSLQLISGLLRLQQSALGDSEASQQLALTANRMAAIGRVHQHLYLGDGEEDIDCRAYFGRLCDDLSANLPPNQSVSYAAVADAKFPTTQIVPLGLIVAELVANAAKHGGGGIKVVLDHAAQGSYALSVSDEGAGLPGGYDPLKNTGFGMRVITTLVGQLHGRLTFGAGDDGRGAKLTVLFPAAEEKP